MKIPTSPKAISYGLMYGIASQDHTFYYDGWDKDSLKKYKRIVTSRFCEQWIAEFCKINGIQHRVDDSHFTENDEYDIIINGWKFDIKSSAKSEYMQVNAKLSNKNVDGYLFCKTNEKMDMIEVVGIINKTKFWENSKNVNHGELTPEGWKQNFKNGSNFLHESEFETKGLDSIFSLPRKEIKG